MHNYYYTYKITLLKGTLTGHYYYGQHRTNNLNDNYCGSGRKLKDYYKKYGKVDGETYIKEILAFYNNVDELNKAETELVADKYKTDNLCLNLKSGGIQPGYSVETRNKISKALKGRTLSEETKYKLSITHKGKQSWLGMHHSEEAKQKIRESKINMSEETKQKIRESILGRHWIHNGTKSKQVDDNCLNYWLDAGWIYGRGPLKQRNKQSNTGKHWIHLDGKTKLVDKDYLNYWLDDGWFYGRKKNN